MNRIEVQSDMIDIIEKVKNCSYESDKISEDTYLGGDLGVNSVEMLEAMYDIQSKYKIKIDDRDLVNLFSIKDVLDVLEKYIS